MIEKSDIILAVWDGEESGTGRSVRYAREMGRRVLEVNTLTLTATPLLKVLK